MGEFPTAKSCWRWGRRQDDGEELRRREEEIEGMACLTGTVGSFSALATRAVETKDRMKEANSIKTGNEVVGTGERERKLGFRGYTSLKRSTTRGIGIFCNVL